MQIINITFTQWDWREQVEATNIQYCLNAVGEDVKVHSVEPNSDTMALCFMNSMDTDEQEKTLAQIILDEWYNIQTGVHVQLSHYYDDEGDVLKLPYSIAMEMLAEVM